MTSPRINESATNHHDGSAPSISQGPETATSPPRTARHDQPSDSGGDDGQDAWTGTAEHRLREATGELRERMSVWGDAGSRVLERRMDHARTVAEGLADTTRAAFDDPGDRVRALKDGERVVVGGGGELSVHAGPGADVSGAASCSVERSGDAYIATFEGGSRLAGGVGAEVQDVGVSADLVAGGDRRVVLRAHGPEGREALADLLDSPLEGDIAERVEAIDGVELQRAEMSWTVGAEADVALLGASASLSGEGRFLVGVVDGDPMAAVEIQNSFSAGTASVETTPEALRKLIDGESGLRTDFVGVPDDEALRSLLEDLSDANGGSIGVEIGVTDTVRLETVGADRTTIVATREVRIGGKTYTSEGTATMERRLAPDALRNLSEGELDELLDSAPRWEVSQTITDFEGFAMRNVVGFDFQNGVETVDTIGTAASTDTVGPTGGSAYTLHDRVPMR